MSFEDGAAHYFLLVRTPCSFKIKRTIRNATILLGTGIFERIKFHRRFAKAWRATDDSVPARTATAA